jgi:hypothetical protein
MLRKPLPRWASFRSASNACPLSSIDSSSQSSTRASRIATVVACACRMTFEVASRAMCNRLRMASCVRRRSASTARSRLGRTRVVLHRSSARSSMPAARLCVVRSCSDSLAFFEPSQLLRLARDTLRARRPGVGGHPGDHDDAQPRHAPQHFQSDLHRFQTFDGRDVFGNLMRRRHVERPVAPHQASGLVRRHVRLLPLRGGISWTCGGGTATMPAGPLPQGCPGSRRPKASRSCQSVHRASTPGPPPPPG